MRRWISLLMAVTLVLTTIIVFSPILTAQACSGGAYSPTLNTWIETADHIVKARIIEKDAVKKNVILEVDKYLTGGNGPRYILWYRVDPALNAIYTKHGYMTGCTYAGDGGLDNVNFPFNAGYFALKRLETGAYITPYLAEDAVRSPAITILPFRGTRLLLRKNPHLSDIASGYEMRDLATEQELDSLIGSLSGDKPAMPDYSVNQLLPLTSPLRFLTDKGIPYILPIDGQNPVQEGTSRRESAWSPYAYPALLEVPDYCATVGCRLTIPDRSSFATLTSTNEITLDYGWWANPTPVESVSGTPGFEVPGITVTGQAFSYSPGSNYLAVWNADRLQIYQIASGLREQALGYPTPVLMVDVALKYRASAERKSLYGNVRWSSNDSTFAYGDAAGLWLMDITHDSSPKLIVPTKTGQLQPLALSTTGRYIAYQVDPTTSKWTLLDRLSGNEHANAIASRDEQYIAMLTQENMAGNDGLCKPPVTQTCPLILNDMAQFEWLNNNFFVATKQVDNKYYFWKKQVEYRAQHLEPLTVDPNGGYYVSPVHFAYNAQSGMLAVVSQSYDDPAVTIVTVYSDQELMSQSSGYSTDPFSTQFKPDNQIVAVEWMPSFFNYAH